jgi:hydrogenase maturation protease
MRAPSPASSRDLFRADGRGAVAPTLVFAVGNLSRGDDAVGPLLAERLDALALAGVEVLVDFQLQVEHALDLEQRERVIFIDACVDTDEPCVERELRPDGGLPHTSHALDPRHVLETYRKLTGREPPPATLLGVRGLRFELGEGLSPGAAAGCAAAWPRLLALCGAVGVHDARPHDLE